MKKPKASAKGGATTAATKKPSPTKSKSSRNAITIIAEPDSQITSASKALAELRKKEELRKWQAAGKTVNDPVQVSKITGIAINVNWTQEEMAYLLKVNPYIQPLVNLRSRADENETKYLAPGRKEMSRIMADIYNEYLRIESGGDAALVYQQLKKHAGTTHADTPNASLLVKVIFPRFDSKRTHTYSRAFEYAKLMNTPQDDYIDFVKREGGVEKIRSKFAKISAATKITTGKASLQIEANAENDRIDRTDLLLEFQRTEPFLKIELTKEQYLRMRPKTTVARPKEKFNMVVMLAEMHPIDFKICNIYGTVPLTGELQKTIVSTLGRQFIRDGAFADRYYAWLDARNAKGMTVVNDVRSATVSTVPATSKTRTKVKSKSKPKSQT